MKTSITVTKRVLDAALKVVSLGVEGSDESKLSSHVIFRLTGGSLELLAAGLRVLASAKIPDATVTGDTDGVFTVASWRLTQWIGFVKNPDELLTVEHKDGVNRLVSSKGSGRTASLDASDFKFWDKSLAESRETTRLPARSLYKAFDFVRRFASDSDTRTPDQCSVQARDGLLWGVNGKVFSNVEIAGTADLAVNVYRKDVSSIMAYLGLLGDDDVEVVEHPNCQFFRHGDTLVGASRWAHNIPAVGVNRDAKPNSTFTIKAGELAEAINYLATFVVKDDKHLSITFGPSSVLLGAKSASGGGDDSVSITPSAKDVSAFEENFNVFYVDRTLLQQAIAGIPADADLEIRLGWTAKKKGAYSIRRNRDGLDTFMIAMWMSA